jgi:hypothetical protein
MALITLAGNRVGAIQAAVLVFPLLTDVFGSAIDTIEFVASITSTKSTFTIETALIAVDCIFITITVIADLLVITRDVSCTQLIDPLFTEGTFVLLRGCG